MILRWEGKVDVEISGSRGLIKVGVWLGKRKKGAFSLLYMGSESLSISSTRFVHVSDVPPSFTHRENDLSLSAAVHPEDVGLELENSASKTGRFNLSV